MRQRKWSGKERTKKMESKKNCQIKHDFFYFGFSIKTLYWFGSKVSVGSSPFFALFCWKEAKEVGALA